MTDLDPPAAFDILADETRVRVLWALAEHQREDPRGGLRFSELRRRVGAEDSGNFDYHLDRLRGTFLEKDGDEYSLSLRGMLIVASMSAGTYGSAAPMPPTSLPDPCPVCGDELTARYEDGVLFVGCDDDHTVSNLVAPEFVRSADVETLFAHLVHRSWLDLAAVAGEVCPLCGGTLSVRTDLATEDGESVTTGVCDQCANIYWLAPQLVAAVHPAMTWFLYDHGVRIDDDPYRTMSLLFADSETVSATPERHEVTVEEGGETLTLTVDGDMEVVDVARER